MASRDLSFRASVNYTVGGPLLNNGTITVPSLLRMQPASKLVLPGLTAKTSVVDGFLYATISSGGTTLILR